MSNLTDDEKANLSPEELAAIEGDEDSRAELEEVAGEESEEGEDEGEEAEESEEGAEDKGESSSDKGGEGDDKGGATDAKAAGDDKGGKEGDQDKGGDAGEEGQDEAASTDFTPRLVADDVTKLTEHLNTIVEQKKALDADFENGDLKHAEYMQKRDELSAQETDMRVQIRQAEFASQQNKKTDEQRWEWEQDMFFDKHEIYTKDPLMHAALDAAVKSLASTKGEDGKLVNAGKSGMWFLEEAHRQVSKRFRIEEVANDKDKGSDGDKGKGTDAQGQDKGKPKSKAGTKPDLKGVPKTLGNLPAAEGNEAAESEFAWLDKLEGIEYEQGLAKLTDEQQARYLKAG